MTMIIQLSVVGILPVIISLFLYLIDKKTKFSKLNYVTKQIIYGLVFGGLAILGTEFGVDLQGASANARDASVLIAGLLFGAPAGIISGLIGGIERYFATAWGAGEYTQLACTISTIVAGFTGAILRKYMFDDKKPSCLYALAIGLITEVFHMLMIFFTNMNDIDVAFSFVQKCAAPMICVNGLSVLLAVFVIELVGEKKRIGSKQKQITTEFTKWLLMTVLFSFIVISSFTIVLQVNIAEKDIDQLLSQGITDVKLDVTSVSDEDMLSVTHQIANAYEKASDIEELETQYNVSEINIVDEKGIITASTDERYLSFDMSEGEQSAEFLVLLNDKTEYVSELKPMTFDPAVYRKYAGVALKDGGFIQVGYSTTRIQQDIGSTISKVIRNRHIGKTGFVLVINEDYQLMTMDNGEEFNITDMPDISSLQKGERFTATVNGEESFLMAEETEGYYILSILPETEAFFSRNIAIYVTIFMEILAFVGMFILVYFMAKIIVIDNIMKINKSLSIITSGNLDETVDVRSNEEFASLSDDINYTVSTLKNYIAEATNRINKALEFSRNIQHSAMPTVFPPYPNRDDFAIYAQMNTAKEVGGDFYDFYLLGRNHLVFLIADVSGKGIPAAMFMMRAKTLIKSYAETGIDVNEIVQMANEKLCEDNDAEMFVTAWIAKINLQTGIMSYANAGHNPPLIKTADHSYTYLHSKPGFVLGGMGGVHYQKNELVLSKGDTVFLYTDGVTEAMNQAKELYGETRLEQVLSTCQDKEVEEVCASVKKDVDLFSDGAPQADDITMLCLQYKGVGEMKEFIRKADIATIPEATQFVEQQLLEVGLQKNIVQQFDIAIDEIVSNICHYAYPENDGKYVLQLLINHSRKRIQLTFIDYGSPFNPLEVKDPDVTAKAEDRDAGGLGIFMVKKLMDTVEYHYDQANILTIEKGYE